MIKESTSALEKGYILVIAEKPDVARKIAAALRNDGARSARGSSTYEIPVAFDGKHYLICSASGHLYGLADPETNRNVFPIFDVEWFPKYGEPSSRNSSQRHSKFSGFVQRKIKSLSDAARNARIVVNACDYDIEGETIGFNALQFACSGKGNSSLRAKFSTLTREEIRQAFSSLEQSNGSLALAGRMRHMVDFLWGVNLSRALTQAANNHSASQFANITIGRVQGPTLAFVADREIEIMTHVPVPSWDIVCVLNKNGTTFETKYRTSPIRKESEAITVFKTVSDASFATVCKIFEFEVRLPPRYPFDLGELQKEAFYNHGLPPSATLSIAEKLYLNALISYPRTESQKLPASINPERILHSLHANQAYSTLIESLLSEPARRRLPLQGPADDPAHPAIYPTGEEPKQNLSDEEKKIYDLIVKRFCNAFAPDALVERTSASFEISSHEFVAEGSRLLKEGWMKYYPSKFSLLHSLIKLVEGEEVMVEKVSKVENYGARPSRYTEGSLLSKMETEGVGTKATRADIISTLIKREYLNKSRQLIPTENALALVDRLRKLCPQILSPDMTRSLEKKLESMRRSLESEELVVEEVLSSLRAVLRELKSMDSFTWQTTATRNLVKDGRRAKDTLLGACPGCKVGNLRVIRSFKTHKRFIGCSNYEGGCKLSSPLPPRGSIKTTKDRCQLCGWPMIIISYFRGARRSPSCSNFSCVSRNMSVTASGALREI
ncbi:MAG: DNA topoisomerase I [Nitrososphaerales archaeon]